MFTRGNRFFHIMVLSITYSHQLKFDQSPLSSIFLAVFNLTPWRTEHSDLSCTDGLPRSGQFSVFAQNQERSSAGLPLARWFLQKTSVLAWVGSAGQWAGLAGVGSGTAEEASGLERLPESDLEAGDWCWLPGCQEP